MEADIVEILTALSEQVAILVEESKENKKFRLKMETEAIPQIKLLAEGFKGYSDRVQTFDQMASDIEDIKLSMDVVEAVVKKQSSDIIKLKAVK